jgi:hypothetical protein
MTGGQAVSRRPRMTRAHDRQTEDAPQRRCMHVAPVEIGVIVYAH